MVWWTQPLEIKSDIGDGHSGRWRMTCESDEGGGFWADESHEHNSSEECLNCERCNDFARSITGFARLTPRTQEQFEREELTRLQKKYGAAVVTNDMVDRFLSWRLPDDFYPDGRVSFSRPDDPASWPVGTNLLTATQAKAMLEYVLSFSQSES